MATTINADTSTGGAIVTGDASGVLELQAAGSTQVTVNGSGVVLANPLPVGSGGTGATSLSGITVGTATNATNATTATNLAGGSNGTIPYQSASGTTQMLAVGTSGQVLQTNGAGAPSWVTVSAGYTLVTPIDTTSGTAITFTGIPSGVKQVIVSFQYVSTSGTSYKWIRLGTSAGLQISTGYENNATRLTADTAIAAINASGGFAILSQNAADRLSGSVILTLQNSSTNTWAAFGILGDNFNGNTFTVAGYVSLSGVLDRISFSADNDSDTFDFGQMNIAYM
jgi:hypothetical protein